MAINLRGLTRETFALRWSQYLDGNGRALLVEEVFKDCEVELRDGLTLTHISRVRFRMGYDEMCESLTYYAPEVLQEIHDRLAGERRRDGKQPSNYTESLLAFVPPDQFVSPDDKESA